MIEVDISAAEAAFASRDLGALGEEIARLFPDAADLGRVGEFIQLTFDENCRTAGLSGTDRIFFENIAETRRRLKSNSSYDSRLFIGTDMDFIGNIHGLPQWTIPQFLNYLAINEIKPTRSAAVIGTMRDDGIYALEWIAYYLTLGFEHIFIYTNNNSDGSEVMLRLLADQKIITLIESETSGKVPPEVKAYEHSIQLLHHLREFEWVLYVDSDEFFIPAPHFNNSIHDVIAGLAQQFPQKRPSAVSYAWLWFVSGMVFERSPGLLIERFQHARHHWISKALVHLPDIVSMRHEHSPDIKAGGFIVDSAFDSVEIDVTHMWERRSPQYSGGRVNHYWPKSFEEFAIKKARGKTLNLEVNSYDRPFELFFAWNGAEDSENRFPIDPAFVDLVKDSVDTLRKIDQVGNLSDRIGQDFSRLLRHYYDGGETLADLYDRHRVPPSEL